RRFLLEEGFETVKAEFDSFVRRAAADCPGVSFDLRELMVVHPTRTPDDSPVIGALQASIRRVLGRTAELIASPGTYDHKNVARIAGVPHRHADVPRDVGL